MAPASVSKTWLQPVRPGNGVLFTRRRPLRIPGMQLLQVDTASLTHRRKPCSHPRPRRCGRLPGGLSATRITGCSVFDKLYQAGKDHGQSSSSPNHNTYYSCPGTAEHLSRCWTKATTGKEARSGSCTLISESNACCSMTHIASGLLDSHVKGEHGMHLSA